MEQRQQYSSDLGCEQALLVVQAVTHVTLQGFLQGLSSGGPQKGQESTYLAILHISATTVSVTETIRLITSFCLSEKVHLFLSCSW